MADDIIIAAATVEEHDVILRKVLARARDCNVRQTSVTCQFGKILRHHC